MNKIYLAIFIFVLFACKSSNVAPSAPTLTFTVYYDSSTKATAVGAMVYLFTDQTSYQAAITGSGTELASHSVQTGTVASNGTVSFSQLAAQSYWVYVSYQQAGTAYNNLKTTFNLKNPLTAGSLTQAVINLKQSYYYTTIQLPSGAAFPLTVTVGDTSFIIISSISNTPYISVNPGTSYSVTSSSHTSPTWTGSVSISASQSGTSQQASLLAPASNEGIIVFWINQTPSKPIFVSLTKATDSLATAEQVGIVSSSLSVAPTSTSYTTNTAYIYTDYNTYYYKAAMVTAGGDSTVYTGTVKLSAINSFVPIKLPSSF